MFRKIAKPLTTSLSCLPQAFEIHREVSLGHEDETVSSDLVERRYLLLERLAFH